MERSFDVVHPPSEAVSTQHEESSTKFRRELLTARKATATEICRQDTVLFTYTIILSRWYLFLKCLAKILAEDGRIGPRGF